MPETNVDFAYDLAPTSPFTLPFSEDFEATSGESYTKGYGAVAGIDPHFYIRTEFDGRMRMGVPFIGGADSSATAITADATTTTDSRAYLYAVLNLASYDANDADHVMLDITYMNHGENGHPQDVLAIRGSGTGFVTLHDFVDGSSGTWVTETFDLSAELLGGSQNFNDQFQLLIGQKDNGSTVSTNADAGRSYDNICIRLASEPNCPNGATIGDRVWEDYDGDGTQDAGEPGIAGVTVELADGTCTLGADCDSTVTDLNGEYTFFNVEPGTYDVTVTLPTGATPTYDADTVGTPNVSTLTVAEGDSDLTQDFGYVWTGSIGNLVWQDQDGDGIKDTGELGLAGVGVELQFVGCTPAVDCPTTTTSGTGAYSFTGIGPRTYTVSVTTPAGTVPTYDSDEPGSPNQSTIALAANAANTAQDFGYRYNGSIGDLVWEDMNGDGIRDAHEPGLAGIPIELQHTNCTSDFDCPNTVTDANGAYGFTFLGPATYTVVVTTPPDSATPTWDFDGTGTAHTADVVIGAGSMQAGADFGYRWSGSIGDFVWDDQNGDGVQDGGEPGLSGMLVELQYAGCTPASTCPTDTTDGSGLYDFSNLGPRSYTVVVTPLAGQLATFDADGGNDDQSSYALTANETITSQDFGYAATGEVSGFIWDDLDNDGTIDTTDRVLNGVRVELQDGVCSSGSTCRTTTTDTNGRYLFEYLPNALYTVVVTPPGAVTRDPEAPLDNEATADLQSGGTVSLGPFAYNVASGPAFSLPLNERFENTSGEIYTDDTTPIAGIDPHFYFRSTAGSGNGRMRMGVFTNDGSSGAATLDSPSGTSTRSYLGLELNMSNYSYNDADHVILEFSYLNHGDNDNLDDNVWLRASDGSFDTLWDWSPTAGPEGTWVDVTVDVTSKLSAANNFNDRFLILWDQRSVNQATLDGAISGRSIDDICLRLVSQGSCPNGATISGRVWDDFDNDGAQDGEEPGLESMTVELRDNGTDALVDTAATDANGNYAFTEVAAGTYKVVVTPIGGTQTFDLDFPATPHTSTLTAAAGITYDTHDFGYHFTGSIGDRIWDDRDGDGVQDGGEPGIAGGSVELRYTGCTPASDCPTTTTDGSGLYSFTGLGPHDYTVVVTPPTGTVPTFDSDSTVTPHQSALTLGVDATDAAQDFGYRYTGSIGDLVWEDMDGDGTRDAGEPALDGVPIELQHAGCTPGSNCPTAVTDASGAYGFTFLWPGTYTVVVTTPPASSAQTHDLDGLSSAHRATISLGAGTTQNAADFGYRWNGSIGDFVWNDQNGNGVQDGEPGRVGVVLELQYLGCTAGVSCPTVVTNGLGAYSFTNLGPRDYTVVVTAPAETAPTFDADGIVTPDQSTVTLTANTADNSQDFGYAYSGEISGTIWEDIEATGTRDTTDSVISGVTVELDNGSCTPGSTCPSTTTDATGHYEFLYLPNGSYTVIVTPPITDGGTATQTASPAGACGVCNHQSTQSVTNGTGSATVHFGYDLAADAPFTLPFWEGFEGTSGEQYVVDTDPLTGTDPNLFFGTTGNGRLRMGLGPAYAQSGVAAATLDASATGPDSRAYLMLKLNMTAYDATVDQVLFDFSFIGHNDPDDGTDRVWIRGDSTDPWFEVYDWYANANGSNYVDVPTIDISWELQNTPGVAQNFGDEFQMLIAQRGSEVNVSTSANGGLTVDNLCLRLAGQDCNAGEIGDRVWNDTDSDGVQDAGEGGIPGIVVELRNGVCTPGSTCPTDTTDAAGLYRFENVDPGSYTVVVTDPPGAGTPTFDADGTGTPHESAVTLVAQQLADDQDFGYFVPSGSLSITKAVTGDTPGYVPGSLFSLSLDCDNDAYDQSFSLANGGNKLISGIPVAVSCSLTETAKPAPAGPNFVWGVESYAPTAPYLIASDGQTIAITAQTPLIQTSGTEYSYETVPSAAISTCNTLTTSTIDVFDNYSFIDVNVGINVSHTNRGKLRFWLTSPAGTRVPLKDYTSNGGGSSDSYDNFDVVFDSSSPNPMNDGNNDNVASPYYERSVGTHNPLTAMNGESSLGTWTLEACSSGNGGTLNRWQLELTEEVPAGSTLSLTLNVTGDTAGYVAASEFAYKLDCNGTSGDNFDRLVYLADGDTFPIGGLLSGDSCTLAPWREPETLDRGYQWNPTTYSLPGPFIVNGIAQTISTTLTREIVEAAGTFAVTQRVIGATAGYTPGSDFQIKLDCPGTTNDRTFLIADGETETNAGLPVINQSCQVIQQVKPLLAAGPYVWGKTTITPGGGRMLRWDGQVQEIVVETEIAEVPAPIDRDITGVVFRDYDLDGARGPLEPGVPGTQVLAYDATGAVVGTALTVQCASAGSPLPACTSNKDAGRWAMDVSVPAPVRVEFQVPGDHEDGVMGATRGPVQFVNAFPATGVDLSIHIPIQYCEANPRVATSCYEAGKATGNSNPAFVSFDWNNDGVPMAYGGTEPNPQGEATIAEVGSIWGAAYQPTHDRMFVGAFTKRHVGFGPRGEDGVYVLDYTTTPASVVGGFDLQGKVPVNGGAAIDLGTVQRTGSADFTLPSFPNGLSIDLDAFDKVSRVSYGDLEMTEDGSTLWLVNLHQRALISVDVSGVLAALPGKVYQYRLEDLPGGPQCRGGSFQPFAIQMHQGRGYVGGVCTAEFSQDPDDLVAYVLSFDPEAPENGLQLEIDFDLYQASREFSTVRDDGTVTRNGTWRPWRRTWAEGGMTVTNPYLGYYFTSAQPVLTSIDFTADGSMVLGVLDRMGHQGGRANEAAVPDLSQGEDNYYVISAGDIIQVCNNGGTWALEGEAGCSTADGDLYPLVTDDGYFGAGEYYWGDHFRDEIGIESNHGEVSLGSVAVLPRAGEVMNVAFDPVNSGFLSSNGVWAGGVHRYDTSVGSRSAEYVIFDATSSPFGKAAGLGDLERICAPAPLEIGNYIWTDTDGDGIMDPGENPIAGVALTLYSTAGATLAQTTTDAGGYFRFALQQSSTADPNTSDYLALLADPYETTYLMAVDASNFSGGALNNMAATVPRSNRAPAGSPRDSDGVDINVPGLGGAIGAIVYVGAAGENDHTIDFGFRNLPPLGTYDLALRLTSGTGNATPGQAVSFLVEVHNQGTLPATDIQVIDYVDPNGWAAFSVAANPPGVTGGTVNLPYTWFDSAPDGYVRITGTIPAGGMVTVPVTLNLLPSARGVISNHAEILVDDGFDIDSQTELEEGNTFADTAVDDVIDNSGGDVDDHDLHQVSVALASVGDYVWLDADADGWQDPDESGLVNVTVELRDDGTNALLATTFTDANGRYLFDDVAVGTYRVEVVTATLPNAGAGLDLSGGSVNPVVGIALAANDAERDADFGYSPTPGTAVVGNFVWLDADADGVQDAGEIGLAGVTLELRLASSGVAVDTATTASDGSYWFTSVAPDEYVVVVTDTGTVLTGLSPTAGPESIGAASSAPFTLLAGSAIDTFDFGYDGARSTLIDRVWHDSDSNGALGGGELGIAGVSVDLLDAGNNVLSTVYSDADGFVRFLGLTDGSYTLRVSDVADRLEAFFATTAPAAAASLAVPIAGTPTTVTGTNFGYNTLGVIGDTIWLDADADGTHDPGEIGLGGVTIELYDGTGTVLLAATTTAADGTYQFTGLFSASYNIVVTDTGNVLSGMTQTADPDATFDSQAFATLGAGESNLEIDFGYDIDLVSLSGTVFRDQNENANHDGGESGFQSVTVALYDTSGNIIAVAFTDGSGDYSFPAVPNGTYQVSVTDISGILDGYHLTTNVAVLDVTVAGVDVNGLDFGYNRGAVGASIGDYVWHDANRDGVQNASESGLPGITINLHLDSNNDGLFDGGDALVATTTTGVDGRYIFGSLSAGRYFVDPDETTLPPVFVATAGTGDSSSLIQLSANESYEDADFGYAPGGIGSAIGDQIFFDSNGNGFPDPGELGIPGVTVTVTGPNGYSQAALTDSRGYYLVTGVVDSGDYLVTVDTGTLPAGIDPVPTLYPSASHTFGVNAGEDLLYADFGFQTTGAGAGLFGSIGDRVFRDANGDGVQGAGEGGIEFVSLNLLDGSGNTLSTTMTDANGDYDFLGLPAGGYRVSVDDPNQVLVGLVLSAGTDPTALIGLAAGEDYNDADFGYGPQGTGSIGDLVWHDLDGDGAYSAGEPGLQWVTVQLWIDNNANGVVEPGTDNLIRVAWTDANGEYLFATIPYGQYLVTVSDALGALAGMTATTGSAGVDNNSQAQPYTVVLSQGSSDNFTADFGYVSSSPFSLSGVVFFDGNANGNREGTEFGVPGATLYLYRDLDGDGSLDSNDPLFGTATSAVGGGYSFDDLPDGSSWIVTADVEGTFLEGGTQTTQSASNGVEPVTIASADSPGHDFGFARPPTAAFVNSFELLDAGSHVELSWTTASEAGTVGFWLYRWDGAEWRKLHDSMLMSVPGAAQGAEYRFPDWEAEPTREHDYLIYEVEAGDGGQWHGPFSTRARRSAEDPTTEFRSILRRSELDQRRLTAHREESLRSVVLRGGEPQTASRLRVVVEEAGIHRIPAGELSSLFGIPMDDVTARLVLGRFSLRHEGGSVAWWRDGVEALLFYAPAPQRRWSATDSYFLTLAAGTTAGAVAADTVGPTDSVAWGSEHFEQDVFAATLAAQDLEEELWFWQALNAGYPGWNSGSFDFDLPQAMSSGQASLSLQVSGATTHATNPDHQLLVSINGTPVDEVTWSGMGVRRFEATFDGGLLQATGNTLEVEAILPVGVPQSVVYVDSFDLWYERATHTDSEELTLDVGDHTTLALSGFSSSDITVLDISDPFRPALVLGQIDLIGSWQVSLATANLGPRLHAATPAGFRATQVVLAPAAEPNLEAEYLVLAPGSLLEGAQQLVDLRASGGLTARAVDVRRIWDDYGAGNPDPTAIHDFLADAWENWTVKPRFVVLAGAGTLDYRDAMGLGTNLIPPRLALTTYGVFASDILLGDVDGDDGVPEIAVGRIPALTNQELLDYVDQLEAWERAPGAPLHFTLLADDSDSAGEFDESSEVIAGLLGAGVGVERIYLDDMPVSQARQKLSESLANGTSLVNYFGHGGLDRLASDYLGKSLLTVADVPGLPESSKAPIFASLTCSAGRFELPGYTSLAEALVLDPNRGAIAMWAPSGLSVNGAALQLDEAFVAALAVEDTLGEAILSAMQQYGSTGVFPELLRLYNLMGDPALDVDAFSTGSGPEVIFSDGFESGGLGSWSSIP